MKTGHVRRRILEGVVISDKMQKTVVVGVNKRVSHPLYKKQIVRRKKYKVHDEENRAKVNDKVRIVECRSHSKEKHFKLLEIVK